VWGEEHLGGYERSGESESGWGCIQHMERMQHTQRTHLFVGRFCVVVSSGTGLGGLVVSAVVHVALMLDQKQLRHLVQSSWSVGGGAA
jgi:hypothetical protein